MNPEMYSDPAWACQHSVRVHVPVNLAWEYMTDVRNWSDPPAEFSIDGPFAPGARGTTRIPGQPDFVWTIDGVDPGRAYTIESGSRLEGASLLICWQFDPLSDRETKMTQRIELRGEQSAAYIDDIRAAFEPNLKPGMERIARLMEDRFGG